MPPLPTSQGAATDGPKGRWSFEAPPPESPARVPRRCSQLQRGNVPRGCCGGQRRGRAAREDRRRLPVDAAGPRRVSRSAPTPAEPLPCRRRLHSRYPPGEPLNADSRSVAGAPSLADGTALRGMGVDPPPRGEPGAYPPKATRSPAASGRRRGSARPASVQVGLGLLGLSEANPYLECDDWCCRGHCCLDSVTEVTPQQAGWSASHLEGHTSLVRGACSARWRPSRALAQPTDTVRSLPSDRVKSRQWPAALPGGSSLCSCVVPARLRQFAVEPVAPLRQGIC